MVTVWSLVKSDGSTAIGPTPKPVGQGADWPVVEVVTGVAPTTSVFAGTCVCAVKVTHSGSTTYCTCWPCPVRSRRSPVGTKVCSTGAWLDVSDVSARVPASSETVSAETEAAESDGEDDGAPRNELLNSFHPMGFGLDG